MSYHEHGLITSKDNVSMGMKKWCVSHLSLYLSEIIHGYGVILVQICCTLNTSKYMHYKKKVI